MKKIICALVVLFSIELCYAIGGQTPYNDAALKAADIAIGATTSYLQQQINSISTSTNAVDNVARSSIAIETTNRINADVLIGSTTQELRNDLGTEITNRQNADYAIGNSTGDLLALDSAKLPLAGGKVTGQITSSNTTAGTYEWIIQNWNSGGTSKLSLYNNLGAINRNVEMFYTGSTYSGTTFANSPTGEQGGIGTWGTGIPFIIGAGGFTKIICQGGNLSIQVKNGDLEVDTDIYARGINLLPYIAISSATEAIARATADNAVRTDVALSTTTEASTRSNADLNMAKTNVNNSFSVGQNFQSYIRASSACFNSPVVDIAGVGLYDLSVTTRQFVLGVDSTPAVGLTDFIPNSSLTTLNLITLCGFMEDAPTSAEIIANFYITNSANIVATVSVPVGCSSGTVVNISSTVPSGVGMKMRITQGTTGSNFRIGGRYNINRGK